MKRRQFVATLIVAPFAIQSLRGYAGGWAVVQLTDPLPTVIAAEPVTIRFRVLQHAKTPFEGGEPVITLTHRETKHVMKIDANATRKDPTVYEAMFEIKPDGEWTWEIYAEPFPATVMPTLRVFRTESEAEAYRDERVERGEVVEVSILGNSFSPSTLEIETGTTVRWTNTSPIPHQVAWHYLHLDSSPMLTQQLTFEHAFDRPGTYEYYCGPHPNMTGMIEVVER